MTTYTLMQLKQNSTPQEFAHHLCEIGPLFWWEPGKFWVITKYDLAKQVLLSSDFSCDRSPFFISRMPEMDLSLIQDFFKVVSKMMVMSDAPLHTARRRICYQGFTNQKLNELKPLVEQTLKRCLIHFNPNEPFDFVKNIAEVIPSTTLAELFAIPDNERLDFYNWSNNMTQFFGGSTTYFNEDGIKVNNSAENLYNYFADLIQRKRANPEDDFLSTLLKYQEHFNLNDDEIISQAIMMLVAGQVTTTDQLCNNLYSLLTIPGLWQKMGEKIVKLDNYIEEANRLDPAVTFIFRVTKNDTYIGSQFIKAGSVIFISTHAINRDPSYFPNPDEIKLSERLNAHFSYGYGGHFCLGAKLARIEMNIVFQTLLKYYPALKLDRHLPAVRKHHSLSFSGFEHLWITSS
ncbi:cytochrome P450 [Legionella gresilensis]|uniref:cytochrome P450 n=1 Tax=Legionella gresilensis TaxID=91823 RepID=UPI0010415A8E|nr:cytochrome P450 [Legionella gresilensis]